MNNQIELIPTSSNPTIKYVEKPVGRRDGRNIELRFGYFGKENEPMCAVYIDEIFTLMIPKDVIDMLADEWFNVTTGWIET